jgi:hypothetical protein
MNAISQLERRRLRATKRQRRQARPEAALDASSSCSRPRNAERFTVTYLASGTVIPSFYCDGATLREVRVAHPWRWSRLWKRTIRDEEANQWRRDY